MNKRIIEYKLYLKESNFRTQIKCFIYNHKFIKLDNREICCTCEELL